MAQIAPQGYPSNYAALLDLLRFGPAVWPLPHLAVLLFHAERSTAMGRDSDQHSEAQASNGIYSVRDLRWIRGPAGISRATWHRANAAMAFDPEDPAKTPDAVLRRIRRQNRYGKDDPTEFSIDWMAVKTRIARWQEAKRVSHSETLRVSERDTQGLSVRHTQVEDQTTRIRGSQRETHSQTDFDSHKSVGHSGSASAIAIAIAIEEATGERPTDRLIHHVQQIADHLNLPVPCTVRFIYDFCFDVRARGYPLRAGLLKKGASEDLMRWIKNNSRMVEQEQHRAILAAQNTAVHEMPTTPDPAFATELLADVAARRGATGAKSG